MTGNRCEKNDELSYTYETESEGPETQYTVSNQDPLYLNQTIRGTDISCLDSEALASLRVTAFT